MILIIHNLSLCIFVIVVYYINIIVIYYAYYLINNNNTLIMFKVHTIQLFWKKQKVVIIMLYRKKYKSLGTNKEHFAYIYGIIWTTQYKKYFWDSH